MLHVVFIPHAPIETKPDQIGRAIGPQFVERISETIHNEHAISWKSFTVYFNDSCVDKLFAKNMNFHELFDRFVLKTETGDLDAYLGKT
uniref:Uncharacterized protein n=1 Tax=viral metagenome TaxID=1070528 RepID=A0A6C0AIH5_9ZZZZ